jgi:hypothetical protein
MDFDNPAGRLGPSVFPERYEHPLDYEDDGTGAGSDFYVWDIILPDSPGSAHNTPSPMSVQAPGIDTGTSLASRLNWTVLAETDHQQVEIKVGESVISVDREIAELSLIELLSMARVECATSCVGTENTWGYIMFIGADSAERFLQIWQRYLVPLGYPMPELEFTARDADWREDIGAEYPFPLAVGVDEEGLTFTAVWRDHRENVIAILPNLAWALRRHLRGSSEA